jgi:hypothetical protein
MSEVKNQVPISKPTVAEPCVSKGGDRVSRDQVLQAIKALGVHDTINSPSFTDGYCPSTLSFGEEPSRKKLQLAKDKLPDNFKDEADKLERHPITNKTILSGWAVASWLAATSS